MRTATSMNSEASDLPRATKQSTADSGPVCAPRKVNFAFDVGQPIFLMRGVFKAILLPDLADSDPGEGFARGIKRRDRPVRGYRLWQRNYRNRQSRDNNQPDANFQILTPF